MSVSAEIMNRLYNFKFVQAVRLAEQDPQVTQRELIVIQSMSRMLGDPGWFEGDMAVIIDCAIHYLNIGEIG